MKIEHIIFDLDNTLYSSTENMDKGISRRMLECVKEFFNISMEEAITLRHNNIQFFSTTLEWLRNSGMTDIEWFFKKVHPENEADELSEDKNLRPFLESIEIPKIIHTNSPKEHAERVLDKLKIRDLFDHICDIRECDFFGKPYPSAFEKALSSCGGTISNTIFIDDMQKYTDGWKAIGGTGILVGTKNGRPLNPKANAVLKNAVNPPGKIINIPDIYALKEILKTI